jgi:2-polyprenyl-6-hydroxyphenyl methylase/3-demethylubiquinone-9 3-methyltransferase
MDMKRALGEAKAPGTPITASAESSLDPAEIAKFEAMAEEWWNPDGKFRPLHMMHPVRLDYAVGAVARAHGRDRRSPRPLAGLRILDIGCGGGLMSEPFARLGAEVVGADASPRNVAVARLHAEKGGLAIDYRHATAEELVQAGERFDAVLNMEVIEHVADPPGFLRSIHALLLPGGVHVCSTINRNAKSYALAILGAERVMRWLPVGTHEWRKFITPAELEAMLAAAGLRPVDRMGVVFNPITWTWRLSERDLSVNYATTSRRES